MSSSPSKNVHTHPGNFLTRMAPADPIDIVLSPDSVLSCASALQNNYPLPIAGTSLRTTIAQLMGRSALMFFQKAHLNATRADPKELNLTYSLFGFVSPKTINFGGMDRLVINRTANSRLQAIITETMAIGVTLLVGEHLFKIPLQFWNPTAKLQRFDLEATHNRFRYGLEAKGRIDFNNFTSAKGGIEDKFDFNVRSPHYHQTLGVIYSPNTYVSKSYDIHPYDALVIDPPTDLPLIDESGAIRSLLRHYSHIFKTAGYRDVFTSIIRVTEDGNSEGFKRYLAEGLPELTPGRKWRVKFSIRDTEYVGTAWSDSNSLFNQGQNEESPGAYMWGIERSIHEAILTGKIHELPISARREEDFWQEPYRYILLGDGSALGWAPSLEDLLEMP